MGGARLSCITGAGIVESLTHDESAHHDSVITVTSHLPQVSAFLNVNEWHFIERGSDYNVGCKHDLIRGESRKVLFLPIHCVQTEGP